MAGPRFSSCITVSLQPPAASRLLPPTYRKWCFGEEGCRIHRGNPLGVQNDLAASCQKACQGWVAVHTKKAQQGWVTVLTWWGASAGPRLAAEGSGWRALGVLREGRPWCAHLQHDTALFLPAGHVHGILGGRHDVRPGHYQRHHETEIGAKE
jgi:hypothetical protein